jgi:hypothetical protein
VITFIFRLGGLNRTIRPVASADNITINQCASGSGLKRPGESVAASFFQGNFWINYWIIFLAGGGGLRVTPVLMLLSAISCFEVATRPHLPRTAATGLDDVMHRGWA